MTNKPAHASMLLSLHVTLLALHFFGPLTLHGLEAALDHRLGPFQVHCLLVPKEVGWRLVIIKMKDAINEAEKKHESQNQGQKLVL